MNVVRLTLAAAATMAIACAAHAQTTTGTQTQAPDQSTAAPAVPAAPVVPKKSHMLTAEEIKASFGIGKAFAATSPAGKVIMITLQPDGTASAVPKGSKVRKKGIWKVSGTGYCSTWAKSTEHCYQIRQAAAGFDVETSTGTVVAHWMKP